MGHCPSHCSNPPSPTPEIPALSVGGAAADRKSLTGEGTFQSSMVRRASVPQLEHGESGSQDDHRADPRRPWTSSSLSCFSAHSTPSRKALRHPLGHSEQSGHREHPDRAANHSGGLGTGMGRGAAGRQTLVFWPIIDQVFSATERLKMLTKLPEGAASAFSQE